LTNVDLLAIFQIYCGGQSLYNHTNFEVVLYYGSVVVAVIMI